jgi:putative Holliday junction resolvase
MNEHNRILGIDYGEKRIGIAITDPLMMFAYPLTTLENNSRFWDKFEEIIDEYQIIKIVLGYPLKENNEKSSSTLLVEKFKEELIKRTKLSVELFDERYSSDIAKERIIQTVTSRKKRRDKGLIDKNAACVILQDYLVQTNSLG